MSDLISEWDIHKDIYIKASGDHNLPWFLKVWQWIYNIHKEYKHDILQVDLARVCLLFDERGKLIKERKLVNCPFWTGENPYPINSLTDNNSIIEFIDDPQKKHIMIQNRERVLELLAEKDADPTRIILVAAQYIVSRTPEIALENESLQTPVFVLFKVKLNVKKNRKKLSL